jgi:hypothetical protein
MVISEKSAKRTLATTHVAVNCNLTLSVKEVGDWDSVTAVSVNRSVLEHLLGMRLRSDAHVLLSEVFRVCLHVGSGELLRQRYLLERHLVNTGAHTAQQRSCGKECTLHDVDSYELMKLRER